MKAKAKARTAAQVLDAIPAPELWHVDGRRILRADGSLVATIGDASQGNLFPPDERERADADLLACAPRLVVALEDCAQRLESSCNSGTVAEHTFAAVEGYRKLIAAARPWSIS